MSLLVFSMYLSFIHWSSNYLSRRGLKSICLARSLFSTSWCCACWWYGVGFAAVELPLMKSLFEGYRKYPFRKGQLYSCNPTIHPERGSIFYIFAGCVLVLRIEVHWLRMRAGWWRHLLAAPSFPANELWRNCSWHWPGHFICDSHQGKTWVWTRYVKYLNFTLNLFCVLLTWLMSYKQCIS